MKNPVVSKVLAIVGTALSLFPIAFMLFTSVVGSIDEGTFLMDYMLPAELGYLVVAGAALLLASAWGSPVDRRMIGIAGIAAIASFVLIIAVAVLSGANDSTDIPGWLIAILTALMILYDLCTAAIGIVGILYLRKLFRKTIA